MTSQPDDSTILDSDELVEVYRTTDRCMADVIVAALKGEGIPCVLEGDHQVFAGVLNVTLFVATKNADAALKFIEQHQAAEEPD